MTASCARGRAGPSPLRWLSAALLLIAIVVPAAAAEPIVVPLDEAKLLQLPERASTVVVGNPLIADLSIQPGGLAVITGKGYGATNFIVLDRAGVVLIGTDRRSGAARRRNCRGLSRRRSRNLQLHA